MPFRFNSLVIPVALVLCLALFAVAGCSAPAEAPQADKSQEQTGTGQDQPAPGTEENALYTPAYKPTGKETVVFKTSQGDITVALFGDVAPIHVGNFVELAKKGFYDKTKFHRYEPGFVVQGGDPQTKDATREEVAAAVGNPASMFGTGGPGYSIKGEFDTATNPNKHVAGALGMARSQNPDSAGSQFYFTLAPAPFLDGNYTVFGKVTDGMDVMEKLRAGDEIISVTVNGAE